MSRMAIRLRTASFAMLLGLGTSSAFAQSPAEFIEQASAKGMADIETSRMAHSKTSSQEIKDYTIEVINERTLANQHLAAIAKKLDLPVAPREKIVDKAETLMPELKDGDSFDAAYAAQQVKENEEAIALFKKKAPLPMCRRLKRWWMKPCRAWKNVCKRRVRWHRPMAKATKATVEPVG